MKVTWLGQAGLLFERDGVTVLIDPYFSDAIGKKDPSRRRRIPISEDLFDIRPDILIFTHDHIDHYDPETAPRFLERRDKPITVLAPLAVWPKAREHGGPHNYVLFNRHTEWTEHGMRFRAVKAEHSDPHPIGVIIEDLGTGCTYYVTGDTLYNDEIFGDITGQIDYLFLPVNGMGNNMNMIDAARFAKRVHAGAALPIHFGMYDDLDPAAFAYENTIILKPYQTIPL